MLGADEREDGHGSCLAPTATARTPLAGGCEAVVDGTALGTGFSDEAPLATANGEPVPR